MSSVDSVTSKKIANASVFATMMIVGIHTLGYGWQSLEKGSTLWWFLAFLQQGLFSIAVPFFFTCSGYFLAGHMDDPGWWHLELKKRIGTLIVPYILWSALFASWLIALDVFVCGHLPAYWRSSSYWINAFGLSPVRYPSLGPLWYIRALVLFVIVSPVVLFAVRRWGMCTLIVLYLLAGLAHPIGRFCEVCGLFFTCVCFCKGWRRHPAYRGTGGDWSVLLSNVERALEYWWKRLCHQLSCSFLPCDPRSSSFTVYRSQQEESARTGQMDRSTDRHFGYPDAADI